MSRRAEESLFVGRLDKSTRVKDLEDIFETYGKVSRCDIKYGAGEMAYAFVDFEDRRDAEDAMRYENGRSVCGSNIIVEWAKGKPRAGGGSPRGGGGYRGGGGGGGFGGGGGRGGGGGYSSDCYNCGRPGHIARDCRSSGNGGGGRGGGGGGGGYRGSRGGGGGYGGGGGGGRGSYSRDGGSRRSRSRSHDRRRDSRSPA